MFRKIISHVSKAMSRGSHSTSTDVSLTDLNLRPSGAGKSIRDRTNNIRMGWMPGGGHTALMPDWMSVGC